MQVWFLTSLLILFALLSAVAFVYCAIIKGDVAGWGFLFVTALLAAIIFGCEGYSPQRLELDDEKIVVLRRYDSVVLLRSNIASIRPLARRELGFVSAMGGCMGLFGYFGSFRNRSLGTFRMYATSFDNLYLIELFNGDKFVVGSDKENPIE